MDCTIRDCASRLAGVTAWTYLSIGMLAFACRMSACVVATSAPKVSNVCRNTCQPMRFGLQPALQRVGGNLPSQRSASMVLPVLVRTGEDKVSILIVRTTSTPAEQHIRESRL